MGFAVVRKKGRAVASVRQTAVGERLTVEVADGRFAVEVTPAAEKTDSKHETADPLGAEPHPAARAATHGLVGRARHGAVLPRARRGVPPLRGEIPEVPPLRIRAVESQRPLPEVSVAGTPPAVVALSDARDRSADRLPAHAAHCSRGVYHASPETALQLPARAVHHGRSGKPAGRPPFRRAADPARRQLRGRGALQPHPRTRRR